MHGHLQAPTNFGNRPQLYCEALAGVSCWCFFGLNQALRQALMSWLLTQQAARLLVRGRCYWCELGGLRGFLAPCIALSGVQVDQTHS